jgi:hypothetical protein
MNVADGLELLPGDDGELPVKVRWVAMADTPEAMAVDGDTLFVAGFTLDAYRLSDGTLLWTCDDEEGMEASGGVRIGIDGPDVVRVFAPWEFDVRADRQTGQLLSRQSAGGGAPSGFVPLVAPAPTTFRVVVTGLGETTAYWPDDRVAWRLAAETAISPFGQLEVDGAIVCGTASQHVVVLDPI